MYVFKSSVGRRLASSQPAVVVLDDTAQDTFVSASASSNVLPPSLLGYPDELLTIVAVLFVVAVVAPTWWIYAQSRRTDELDSWPLWTGGMLVSAVVFPVVAPIIVFVLYAAYIR